MELKTLQGNRYLEKIPKQWMVVKVKFKSGVELMQLQKGRRVWKTDNLELRDSLPILIYSPSSNKYWYRELHHRDDLNPLRRYASEGNLYIVFNQKWQEIVSEERNKEGMPYNSYNRIRELVILREVLEKAEITDEIGIKMRAIDLEIKRIKNK